MFSLVLGSTTTGYKLLPSDSDSLELPPPDYNEVVNTPPGTVIQPPGPQQRIPPTGAGSQPSAPPLSELELAAAENPPPSQSVATDGGQGQRAGYGTGGNSYVVILKLKEFLILCCQPFDVIYMDLCV